MQEPQHTTLEQPPSTLSDLPLDELIAYAQEIGVRLDKDIDRGEVLRLIRQRREQLVEVERDALLDVCIWARKPVRKSASKEELAKEIVQIKHMRFDSLSDRGVSALCLLRGVDISDCNSRDERIRALKQNESLASFVNRQWRRGVGSILSHLIAGESEEEQGNEEYRFLPEKASLKDEIEQRGIVSGITQKLRGVADDYVREKLDEIELRIDRKLDEIDARLGEWRDREIKNRLRIIRITLVATIVVALISLGYDYLRTTFW